MAAKIDLQHLVVERPTAEARLLLQKRSRLTRWLIPLAIVGGFMGITGWSARDQLLPAQPVTVTPVVMGRAEAQRSGTPLFQAAGWIEPRPTAVLVSALTEGIVEKLLVIEGQQVAAGDAIAQLNDAEARIALREVEATKQLREAELQVAEAAFKAAQANLEHPLSLQATYAEAEAALAKLATEISDLPFSIRAAEARLQLARQDLDGKKSVSDALPNRSIQKAQSEYEAAHASLDELKAHGPRLEIELRAWQQKCDALRNKLELKTAEKQEFEESKAKFAAAKARLLQADLAIESATLRAERMTVRAPITGRVLMLNAKPGQRLMGINSASERDASTVISMYDPKQLQVRADVRLEDVAHVQQGQLVQISTASFSKPLMGTVLTVTSTADIQKNTLQVKVSITEPPAVLKPEMLAQVVFLAPENDGQSKQDRNSLQLLVPRGTLEKTDQGHFVWVADLAAGVARRKAVQIGTAGNNELVEVTAGLTALDKLIVTGREQLSEGTRIRVSGEDQALGRAPTTADARTASVKVFPNRTR